MSRKAFAYRRVSTQQQTEKFGLDVQDEEIKKYAGENDIEIVENFCDEGITGKTADRNGLQDMLVALKDNKDVKLVVVLNCSRLWRSEEIAGLLRYELFKMKVDIASVQEPTFSLYTSDPSTFLVNQIMQALASYDRMQITQKLARARRLKASSKGQKACGSAPIGYKWNNNAEIEIDDDGMIIVTDIFRSYIELRSFGKVAEYCKSKGYKTVQGNDFSKQSISNILHNDFYVGRVRHSGQDFPGTQPTFITQEIFDTVQNLMEDR